MQENYEVRIDNVNREDIWKKEVEAWLDTFKTEETPIEKRITDYRINGYSVDYNNEEKIQIDFYFEVTPIDENNTEWNAHRELGFIEMTKIDGEYQLDYLSNEPKGYDKFLEEFEIWKKDNSTTETVTLKGENVPLNSAQEQNINKLSTGIVAVCVGVLAVIAVLAVVKIIKFRK